MCLCFCFPISVYLLTVFFSGQTVRLISFNSPRSSCRGDWTGLETSTQEHMKMWWDLTNYRVACYCLVTDGGGGGTAASTLCSCLRSLFCTLGRNCRGLFECGWFEPQIAPAPLISDGELQLDATEFVICSDGLTIFSPDCSTADRVGGTAAHYAELSAPTNQKPSCTVSASLCVWTGLWLVPVKGNTLHIRSRPLELVLKRMKPQKVPCQTFVPSEVCGPAAAHWRVFNRILRSPTLQLSRYLH